MLIKRPNEKERKPKLTVTVENPIFKASKKKLFTGPLGKMLLKKYANTEPMIPPIIIPKKIVATLLLAAIKPPYLINRSIKHIILLY